MNCKVIIRMLLFLSTVVESVVVRSCTKNKQVALTFDEGPIQGNTGQILDALKANNVKGTFHFNSNYLSYHFASDLLLRAFNEGHLIGIRFDTQFGSLTGQDDSTILSSLQNSANGISIRISYTPRFVRLPFNGYDERVIKLVEQSGYVITEPTIDSMDYKYANVSDLVQAIGERLNTTSIGVITKQLDASAVGVSATDSIIKEIKRRGYSFVTLDVCTGTTGGYKENNPNDSSGPTKTNPDVEKTTSESSSANNLQSMTGLILIASTFIAVAFQIL